MFLHKKKIGNQYSISMYIYLLDVFTTEGILKRKEISGFSRSETMIMVNCMRNILPTQNL